MKAMKTLVALVAAAAASGAMAQQPQAGAPAQPPAAASAQPAAGGDAERGRASVRMCQGCHGIEGWRTAFPEVYAVPKLGGQHAQYLVNALQAYKSGARSHPTMRAIAASLSDREIADLAAYYAQPAPSQTAAGK
jgi:cytochrome c553